jgi:hypothetical protein
MHGSTYTACRLTSCACSELLLLPHIVMLSSRCCCSYPQKPPTEAEVQAQAAAAVLAAALASQSTYVRPNPQPVLWLLASQHNTAEDVTEGETQQGQGLCWSFSSFHVTAVPDLSLAYWCMIMLYL